MGRTSAFGVAVAALLAVACASDRPQDVGGGRWRSSQPLVVSAIPDQDPQRLERLYGLVAEYLSDELGVPVSYEAVSDYTASVTLFRLGELDLVWYGGLTGVQARLQTPGAHAIAQRDIDARFHSVFIANTATGLEPFDDLAGLAQLAGLRFTFGSEISTSGRLMPQYFLERAGVGLDDFDGEPGFSGDHDKTIDLVESGTYEAGAVNEQVWDARVAEGSVDTDKVIEVFRTPAYHDYHWVIAPGLDELYGPGFVDAVTDALLALDGSDERERQVLELFGAKRFISTEDGNYARIEQVARDAGLIR
jgi:phosphonate transport system substrate-binding protein